MLDHRPAAGQWHPRPGTARSMVGRTRAPSVGRPYQVPERTSRPLAATLPRVTRRSSMPAAAARPRRAARGAPARRRARRRLRRWRCPRRSMSPRAAQPKDAPPAPIPTSRQRIPTSYEGRAPDTLDSGRHCDPDSLGSLATAGFDEVRFAGGTWDFGGESRGRARGVPGARADGRAGRRFLRHERADARTARQSPAVRRPRSPDDPATGSTR